MTDDRIIDAAEAAALLRCEPETAEDLMRREELPATKIGRSWITTNSEVLAFVRKRIHARRERDGTQAEIRQAKKRGPPPLPVIDGIDSPGQSRAGSRT